MHSKAYFGLSVGTLATVGRCDGGLLSHDHVLRMMEASCQHNGLFFGDSWFGSVELAVWCCAKQRPEGALHVGHQDWPSILSQRAHRTTPRAAACWCLLTATVEGVALVALGNKYNRKKPASIDVYSLNKYPTRLKTTMRVWAREPSP
jgi:hypothetical protein